MIPTNTLRLAAASTLLALLQQAHAASDTWSATPTDGNWSTATNWVGGNVPGATSGTTSADVATFGTGSTTTALVIDAGRNIGGITFATTLNTYTIGAVAGNTLLLSSGGTIQSTAASGNQVVNAPLQIQGENATYAFHTDTPGGSRVLTFGGAISGASSAGNVTTLTLSGVSTTINTLNGAVTDGVNGGKLAVVKNGTGQWNLAAGTFSGGLTVNAGTLRTGTAGNTTGTLGSGLVTLNGGGVTLGSTNATNFNNALSVGAAGGTLTVRSNHTFNPASASGTGTLNLRHSNTAGTVITTTDLKDFSGTINLAPNGANSLGLRFSNTPVYNSGRNAAFVLAANTSITTQAATNGTFVIELGALSGDAGSALSNAGGAGAGTFVYQIGNRNETTAFSGNILNGGTKTGLAKVGSGSLTLAGAGHTFTGGVTINGGSLVLGASNLLPDANNLTLGGGTFALAGFSETLSGLSLTDATTSKIDFGTGAAVLLFSSVTGTGALDLLNWTEGSDSLRFTADPSAFLSQIKVNGLNSAAINQGAYWEIAVAAIPEPSAFAALAGLGALAFATSRRRSRA